MKNARASLKQERQPVAQVVAAQKEVRAINHFVKIALSEKNRWILHTEEQTGIVDTLKAINRIYTELYDKCRTPYHFQKNAAKFTGMKNEISHLISCIHLSLDQGFYLTEPRGLSPGKAVQLSWEQQQAIFNDARESGKWTRLPIEVPVSEEEFRELKGLEEDLKPLAKSLINNPRLNSFENPMSIEDIQSVYHYFQKIHRVLELEDGHLEEMLESSSNGAESFELDQVFLELQTLEAKMQQLLPKLEREVPDFSSQLYQSSRTDAMLRMNLLRVPLEPMSLMRRSLTRLERDRELDGEAQSARGFHDSVVQELKLLRFFLDTLEVVNDTLHQVISILYNLSISFGKIYHNASGETISIKFLERALTSVKGLLEKGLRVTATRKDMLLSMQTSVKETELFDTSIVNGLLYSLRLIDEAREEMQQYTNLLEQHLDTLNSASDWSPKRVYIMLQTAYEERTALSSASMVLDSVTHTCELLNDSLKEINQCWKKLEALDEEHTDPATLYEKTRELLTSNTQSAGELVQANMLRVHELQWVLDEMLIRGTSEEQRFLQELKAEMEPVRVRINARRKKIHQHHEVAESKKAAPHAQKKPAAKRKKGSASKTGKVRNFSKHDPFPAPTMEVLKKTLKEMDSEQGKMMYFVMTHTHMFSNLLDKLEQMFNQPNKPTQYQLEQALMKSMTTNDFLLHVARSKFMDGGYFNAHNIRYPYNDDQQKFEIVPGADKFLQLSKSSYETPDGLYLRLVRLLLGMDDPGLLGQTLGRQALAILETDFMLSKEEKDAISRAMA